MVSGPGCNAWRINVSVNICMMLWWLTDRRNLDELFRNKKTIRGIGRARL